MVITVLEAHVSPDRWEALQTIYRERTQALDPRIVQTHLIQSVSDRNVWRIQTTWKSRDALDEMRRTTDVPEGVVMFRHAGAEPTLSVFDVIAGVPPAMVA